MHTDRQFKNEVGNKVSRQVECGTRQRVKVRDCRQNVFVPTNQKATNGSIVLQLYNLIASPIAIVAHTTRNNEGCLVDSSKEKASWVFKGDYVSGHSEEKMIDALYGSTIAKMQSIREKQSTANSLVRDFGVKKQDMYTFNIPCNGNYSGGRFNCHSLLSTVLDPNSNVYYVCNNRLFTPAEDTLIRQLVASYATGEIIWVEVARKLPGRSGKQVRERYENFLTDPQLEVWTEDEDKMLKQRYEEFGAKWEVIAYYFPEKTSSMVKNRYYSVIRNSSNLNNKSQGQPQAQVQDYKYLSDYEDDGQLDYILN